eukprot:TRINITY_DN3091_c3_g1_i2.p1 TRINITY_DN3091_c3_g1~~TRINITY_DN3091_c3_g1_i2.p1  ORF type:complete len:102 (+),score=4.40 TRINITY_DN3091_c3_g1_i2:1-306(+)
MREDHPPLPIINSKKKIFFYFLFLLVLYSLKERITIRYMRLKKNQKKSKKRLEYGMHATGGSGHFFFRFTDLERCMIIKIKKKKKEKKKKKLRKKKHHQIG